MANKNHGKFQKPKNTAKTARRLVGYLTRSKLPLLFVLLCLVLSVGSSIGGDYMLRGIINRFLWSGCTDFAGLTRSVLLLITVYAAGALATYFQSAAMVRLAQKGVNRLRRELFDKLQNMPLSYFDKHTHGELMSRFTNDADNVQAALEQSVVSMCSSVLMFVGLVILMLFMNWQLFFASALILLLTFLFFKNLGGRSRVYYQKQQAALGAVNGEVQETIEGLKVIKAFTHEEQSREKFRALNENYRQSSWKANFYSSIIMPVAANLNNASYALTAVFGGILSIVQGFDLGGLVVYLNFAKKVSQPLNQISQQMTTLLSALAGAERIFEVMDAQPEVDEGQVTLAPAQFDENGELVPFEGQGRPHTWVWKIPKTVSMELVSLGENAWGWKYPGPDGTSTVHPIRGAVRCHPDEEFIYTELKGAVRFSHVNFSYVPGEPILKDVSVYANPGEKLAFVGSTGAGKTTITNLINRFYEIDGGLITYDGMDVKNIRKDDLRRSLGAVLQDTHLFTGTIMENIRYGRLDATDEECIEAAKSANAHSFIRRLPQGYQTMISGDGSNLSQGQRQLLAIARAAVADPPVMILDEATSSIDTRTEALIQKGMDRLMEGRTVFVIAHRLSTVRNSNCIVVIEHGQIEEKGAHEALLEEKGRYYQLYTGQFQLS